MSIFLKMGEGIRSWLGGIGVSPTGIELILDLLGILLVIVFLLLNALYLVYLERKISAYIQVRLGPNRLGPRGLFQTFADILKLISKEDITPSRADKVVFAIAPVAVFIPALMGYAVMPFDKNTFISDLNIGLFYIIALGSTTTLAFLMAGWSSNNKYSLLGAMRQVAQMISYEIPMVFSLIGVIMITGTLKLSEIVEAQRNVWFILPQIIAFLVYFISAIAETNRAPFDLPEGEQELVSGALTEYTGMKWTMFFLAEYTNLIAVSGIITSVFLGGYLAPLPGVIGSIPFIGDIWLWIPGWIWFTLKYLFVILMFMWVRWTYPRIRVDHLMAFGWKVLIPVSLANIVITGVGVYLYQLFKGVL